LESVQNLKDTDNVGSIVWAYPSLMLIKNDDLDAWKFCRGVIKEMDLVNNKILIGFYVGPVPIKKEVIMNLLKRRYTGEDSSKYSGVNQKKFPSVLKSLWAFRQLLILLKLPKNANTSELDAWLKSKQKQHQPQGALSIDTYRELKNARSYLYGNDGEGTCKKPFLIRCRTWAMLQIATHIGYRASNFSIYGPNLDDLQV
jgi:hypothetical protein